MKLEDEGAESGNGCRISSTFPVSRSSGIENSRRRRLAVQQILFCLGRQCLVLDLFVHLIFHLLLFCYLQGNKRASECPKCQDRCPAGGDGRRLCWNNDDCQKGQFFLRFLATPFPMMNE